MAIAAALATMDLLEKKYIANAKTVGDHILSRIAGWPKKHKIVGDVRCKGCLMGIELVKDRKTKQPDVQHFIHRVQSALLEAMQEATFDFVNCNFDCEGAPALAKHLRPYVVRTFPGVRVGVPQAVVLATDVFDRFLDDNDLRSFAIECEDDAEAAGALTPALGEYVEAPALREGIPAAYPPPMPPPSVSLRELRKRTVWALTSKEARGEPSWAFQMRGPPVLTRMVFAPSCALPSRNGSRTWPSTCSRSSTVRSSSTTTSSATSNCCACRTPGAIRGG